MNGLRISRALPAAILASLTAGCVAPGRTQVLWTTPLVGWGRPSVRADSVYMLSRAHEMVALDKTTGAVRWRRPLPPANGEYSPFPMGSVVESTTTAVIVGDYDVLALDRRSGRLV